jgi:hypothetical protein
MNILNRTTLIAFIALLVGGIVGAYIAYRVTIQSVSDSWMLELATSAQFKTNVLRGLRENDKEGAIRDLEAQLDSRIVFLNAYGSYSDVTNRAVRRAILEAKDYRAKYPRKTDYPDTDAHVTEILNSVQDDSPHKP